MIHGVVVISAHGNSLVKFMQVGKGKRTCSEMEVGSIIHRC